MGSSVSTNVDKLNLKKKSIKDLGNLSQFNLISQFTELQSVNLSKNKLKALPDTLCKLVEGAPLQKTLTSLRLDNNRIQILNNFPHFMNLAVLDLSHNALFELPASILNVNSLESLNLSHNAIFRLPWRMDRLKNLKTLKLEHNKITFLPNNIGLLENLQEFTTHSNPLITINNEQLLNVFEKSNDLPMLLNYLLSQQVPESFCEQSETQALDNEPLESPNIILLQELLKDPKGSSLFEAFLESEKSLENLQFWRAVMAFKAPYLTNTAFLCEELSDPAKKVYHLFIADDAPSPINISAKARLMLCRIFKHHLYPKGVHPGVFNDALFEVENLMSRDTLRRFKGTEEGGALVQVMKERVEGREKTPKKFLGVATPKTERVSFEGNRKHRKSSPTLPLNFT
eukprot:TRINITY_DN21682_c0_g1_i1.p1 TRINITY_DN21682_c0_g1~~TRINITY_DN21682_c0_g1_i1.p1  ORF type:complete len:400 (-),score=107.08 TRINITY_DN21682_c0_g1_i1:46-1245(-)